MEGQEAVLGGDNSSTALVPADSPTAGDPDSETRPALVIAAVSACAGVLGAVLLGGVLAAWRSRRPVLARARSWHAATPHATPGPAGNGARLSTAMRKRGLVALRGSPRGPTRVVTAGTRVQGAGGPASQAAAATHSVVAVANQVQIGNPVCSPRNPGPPQ